MLGERDDRAELRMHELLGSPLLAERRSGAVEIDGPVSSACKGQRRQTAALYTREEQQNSGADPIEDGNNFNDPNAHQVLATTR